MLRIEFTAPMLVGGGEAHGGVADRATLKSATGLPELPTSAIKGAWRIELERLSRSLPPADRGEMESACHVIDGEQSCSEEGQKPCIACFVFGNASTPGKLRLDTPTLNSDAVAARFSQPELENINPLRRKPSGHGYAIRQRVAINRNRQVAEDQRLFSLEGTEPGLKVPFTVGLTWLGTAAELESIWKVTAAAARLVSAIGASRGVGYGACRVTVAGPPLCQPLVEIPPEGAHTDLLLCLRLLQPACLALPRRAQSYAIEGYPHLTASALRGAIAAALVRLAGEQVASLDAFRSLFLDADGDVRFDDAYPIASRIQLPMQEIVSIDKVKQKLTRPLPAPFSAQTCKHRPGALLGGSSSPFAERPHGVFDGLLLSGVLATMAGESIAPLLTPVCPKCDEQVVPYRRLVTNTGGEVPPLRRSAVTRVAISRQSGRARDQQLYSMQVIDAATVFIGRLRNLTPRQAALLSILHGNHIEVGSARSRGMGRTDVFLAGRGSDDDPWGDRLGPLPMRFSLMSKTWKQVADRVSGVASVSARQFAERVFSVTLVGDALLGREGEPARTYLVPADVGLGATVHSLATFSDYRWRRGYDALCGIRKPQELASQAGATTLFAISHEAMTEEELLQGLGRLEKLGVGRRRTEGFGEVVVCHPFHSRAALDLL